MFESFWCWLWLQLGDNAGNALIKAATKGHSEIVELLLKTGANVNEIFEVSLCVLSFCCVSRLSSVIEIISCFHLEWMECIDGSVYWRSCWDSTTVNQCWSWHQSKRQCFNFFHLASRHICYTSNTYVTHPIFFANHLFFYNEMFCVWLLKVQRNCFDKGCKLWRSWSDWIVDTLWSWCQPPTPLCASLSFVVVYYSILQHSNLFYFLILFLFFILFVLRVLIQGHSALHISCELQDTLIAVLLIAAGAQVKILQQHIDNYTWLTMYVLIQGGDRAVELLKKEEDKITLLEAMNMKTPSFWNSTSWSVHFMCANESVDDVVVVWKKEISQR